MRRGEEIVRTPGLDACLRSLPYRARRSVGAEVNSGGRRGSHFQGVDVR